MSVSQNSSLVVGDFDLEPSKQRTDTSEEHFRWMPIAKEMKLENGNYYTIMGPFGLNLLLLKLKNEN